MKYGQPVYGGQRRAVAAVAWAVLMVLVAGPAAQGARAAAAEGLGGDREALAGVTTFTFDRPATARVYVPEDAWIGFHEYGDPVGSFAGFTGVEFSGNSPLLAIALVSEEEESPGFFVAGRQRSDGNVNWTVPVVSLSPEERVEENLYRMPAGNYLVYGFTAPGHEASIELTLMTAWNENWVPTQNIGGSGTQPLEPTAKAGYRQLQERLVLNGFAENTAHSVGHTVETTTPTVSMVSTVLERHSTDFWWLCIYDHVPDPEEYAYMPGCPPGLPDRPQPRNGWFRPPPGKWIFSFLQRYNPHTVNDGLGPRQAPYGMGHWVAARAETDSVYFELPVPEHNPFYDTSSSSMFYADEAGHGSGPVSSPPLSE